jgi:hypothetical protein
VPGGLPGGPGTRVGARTDQGPPLRSP